MATKNKELTTDQIKELSRLREKFKGCLENNHLRNLVEDRFDNSGEPFSISEFRERFKKLVTI